MYEFLIIVPIVISIVSGFSTTVTIGNADTATEDATTVTGETLETEVTFSFTTETLTTLPSQESNDEYSPFQVSLHYSYNDAFICGGSIISSKTVLTAAQCMYYTWGGLMPPIIVIVAAGKKNLDETAWKNFTVANITLHPEHDLALIEIDGVFEVDNFIGKIDVAKYSYLSNWEYDSCVLTGWDKESNEFRIIEVTLVNCINTPRQICTVKKDLNSNLCIKDAGNPLVCNEKLVGVLSKEPNCEDPNQFAVFENVRHSITWLNENVKGASGTINIKIDFLYNLMLMYIIIKYVK